jgi:flagellar biogenesis protein FliO
MNETMRYFLSMLALLAAFIVLASLLRKVNERLKAKYHISLARYVKSAVYISAAVIVVIAAVSVVRRSADLSTPLGRLVALHWRAGDPTVPDCQLCPDGLFMIMCNAEKRTHIRSMRELASLQADRMEDRTGRSAATDDPYSCIANRSFRLTQPSGAYGGSYDPDDPGSLRYTVSFHVIKENDAEQIVEVHYRDDMRDIVDSVFRYEVRDDTINALESWVLFKYQVGLFLILAILASIILLYGGTRTCISSSRNRKRKKR